MEKRLELLTRKQPVARIKEERLRQNNNHAIALICLYVPRPTDIMFAGDGIYDSDDGHNYTVGDY